MSSLGENLKNIRSRAGLTQKDVESALGLRELSLKDYETERLKLPAGMALKLAQLYKVSVDELLGAEPVAPVVNEQSRSLSSVGSLFSRSEISLLYMDPVIRAYLEGYRDQLLDHSPFELLTRQFTAAQRKKLAEELLRSLASLMGVDARITREEIDFLHELIQVFGLGEKAKGIVKTASARHLPDPALFRDRAEAKHFLLWLMFFVAKSDGAINEDELKFIEKCAETLKVSRSNFLYIEGFFKKEKY
jgi:transcriptional regulator with XRE-family HTH domain/uncharacterized tellurite resistance protein B-like protein